MGSSNAGSLRPAMRSAMRLPAARLPRYPRHRTPPMPPEVPERIAALRDWRDRQARKLGLDPAVLFNKAQLFSIARACPRRVEALKDLPEIRRWQIDSFGRNLIAVLCKLV